VDKHSQVSCGPHEGTSRKTKKSFLLTYVWVVLGCFQFVMCLDGSCCKNALSFVSY
jgi:hypothetical protein